MRQLDSLIFNALNGLAGKSPVFDAFAVFSASALIWIIGASVLVPVWRARGNHREHVAAAVTASRAASAALLGVFGNLLVSLAYFRPRPFVMMAEATPLIGIMPASKSFPSDHATIAFAVAASVFMRSPGMGAWLLAAAALVALGRVLVGVHYPSDVLAGAVVGCLWAQVVRALGPRFREVETMERLVLGRHRKNI